MDGLTKRQIYWILCITYLGKEVLNCDYLQTDESPIGVQDLQKKGALFSRYQWVYRTPE